MPAFSSVARKPGLAIKPRAAPRRNVQRHAQKPTVTSALTPESLPQSPIIQPIPSPSETAGHRISPVREDEAESENVASILTPPATAVEAPSPAPQPATEVAVVPSSGHALTETVTSTPVTGNEIPAVNASKPPASTRTKRRADAVTHALENGADSSSQSQKRTNKRRKVAPHGAVSYLFSRPTDPVSRAATETPADDAAVALSADRPRASTEDLLQQAKAQFSSVSAIADSIESRTRNLRPRTGRASTAAPRTQAEEENTSDPSPQSRHRFHQSARTTATEAAAQAVIDAASRPSRKRRRASPTPSDPESHEIDPSTCTMGSLTKDRGLGRQSTTGKELHGEEWPRISQTWKDAQEDNRRVAQEKTKAEQQKRKQKAKADTAAVRAEEESESMGLLGSSGVHVQLKVVNGNIAVDEESRQIEFGNNLDQRAQEEAGNAREYRKIEHYINQSRIGKHAGLRGPGARWDDSATDLFYKGLRMFGTDFEMVSSLFPGRTRHEVKTKYTREERAEWDKVQDNLRNREKWTMEEVAKLTGREDQEWVDPLDLEREFKETEERMIAEAKERDREAGLVADVDEADLPIPTIEGEVEVDADMDTDGQAHVEGEETAPMDERTRRINDLAAQVVADAVRPPDTRTPTLQKKVARPRTKRDASKVVRGKKGQKSLAGVEERIGQVGEVEL